LNKKAYDLLEKLIYEVDVEKQSLEDRVKNGTVADSLTNAEVLTLMKNLISDIVRVERIKSMLEDIKSIMPNKTK
jgi:hypothetical protein